MKTRAIAVDSLKGVSVLFPNDLYKLASFILKAFDAKNRGTNQRSRPTLHGLACAYANLIHDLRVADIEEKLKQQGFDLGATVEWEEVQPMPKKKPPAVLSKDHSRLKVVKAATGPIYQLKITLNNVKPPIWRRLQTKDCTLADLHDIIQVSMGWHDGHLHFFEIGGERFGLPEQWEQDFVDDDLPMNSRKVKLSQVVAQGFKKFKYLYDMGDGWEHTVLIEKTVEVEQGVQYPMCIDGKRACPPEDCGGPWGYGDLLDALSDPTHERHADMVEWIGGKFDAEAFDLDETNEGLAGM